MRGQSVKPDNILRLKNNNENLEIPVEGILQKNDEGGKDTPLIFSDQ